MANADVIIRIRAEVEQAKKDLMKVRRSVNAMAKPSIKNFEQVAKAQESVIDGQKRLRRAQEGLSGRLKANEGRFQGWALSVMFFGMAIQQVFSSLWKQSSSVFNDVMHSVEGTTTGFDLLNGSVTYLMFTIGQALEPVAALLAPVIMAVADWVTQNQELTAGIIKWGFIIGSVLFIVGFLTLAFNGVITAIKNIGTIIGFVFGEDFGKVIAKAGGLLKWLGVTGFWSGVMFLGIVAAIILMLYWLYKVKEEFGTWQNFFVSIVRGIIRIFVFLGAVIAGVFSELWNFLKEGWNNQVRGIQDKINAMIAAIEVAVNALRNLLGKKSISLGRVNLEVMTADVKDFGESFKDVYGSIMEQYFALEDKYLHIDNSALSGTAAKLAEVKKAQDDLKGSIIGPDLSKFTEAPTTSTTTYVTNFNDVKIEGSGLSAEEIMAEYNRLVTAGGSS